MPLPLKGCLMPGPAGVSLGLFAADVLFDLFWLTLLFIVPKPSKFSLPSKEDLVGGGPIMD